MAQIGINALFLAPNGGGIWTYFANVLSELIQIDPHMVPTVFSNHRLDGHLNGHKHIAIRRTSAQRLSLATAFLRMPVDIRRLGLDLLWSPTPLAPPRLGMPSVVTLHDVRHEDLRGEATRAERTLLSVMARRAARGATRILTDSEHAKRRIMHHYAVPAERIDVAHLAPDPRFFVPVPPDERQRTLARYAIRPPYILAAATSHPHKNPEALLDAFRALRQTGTMDMRLVMFGAHRAMSEKIRGFIRAAGMEREIVLTDWIDAGDVPALYQGATVCVHPSRYEGFGLPVVEAMASGTPVITTTATALPEVAGDAALLFDPDDRAALAEALRRLVHDPAARATFIARGHARARHFTWRHTAAVTLNAMRRAIGDRLPQESFRERAETRLRSRG